MKIKYTPLLLILFLLGCAQKEVIKYKYSILSPSEALIEPCVEVRHKVINTNEDLVKSFINLKSEYKKCQTKSIAVYNWYTENVKSK